MSGDRRSSQDDGPRPAASEADAFQEALASVRGSPGRPRAGAVHAAANDGAVGQANAMDVGDMPGDRLLRTSGRAGGPSDLEPRMGSGPGIRTETR